MSGENGDAERAKALDRVRKLLALAGNNPSPEEAALAAAKAAAIMEEHAIAHAEVDAGDQEDAIEHHVFGSVLRRKSTWQGCLARVVAEAFGCSVVWYADQAARAAGFGGMTACVIAGRPEDVAAAKEARDWCHREVDRLTASWAQGRGRGWGVSFRMGCVHAIAEAIERERAELRSRMRGKVSDSALVVYDERSARARESFGKTKPVKSKRDADLEAYATGIMAGRDVWTGTKKRVGE